MMVSITKDGYQFDCPEKPEWQSLYAKDKWSFLLFLALSESVRDEKLNCLVSIAEASLGEAEMTEGEASVLSKDRPFDAEWVLNASAAIREAYQKKRSGLCFHLVENPANKPPFAFLATYSQMSLSHALKTYHDDPDALLQILIPLSRIAGKSPFMASLLDSGDLFKAIGLTAEEAYTFLKETPCYQDSGVCCRIPDFWKRKTSRFVVKLVVGSRSQGLFGIDSLLDCEKEVLVNEQAISDEELKLLVDESNGLRMIKGGWVEVDQKKLQEILALNGKGLISLSEILHSHLGFGKAVPPDVVLEKGPWMEKLLAFLQHPAQADQPMLPSSFRGTLRAYQRDGFSYLYQMNRFSLGCCLADDMGLGKTAQVLALITTVPGHILLVVPTSLVGNWESEMEKFTPSLHPVPLTGSSTQASVKDLTKEGLYLTTYPLLGKLDNVNSRSWDLVVIDEAQAIKNKDTEQSRAVRSLKARERIALTGTPLENSLSDVWTLFDWLNPGMLGSYREFTDATRGPSYEKLREILSPFTLRRMKTDKRIISDLPEKMEVTEHPLLTPLQHTLYQQVVSELAENLQGMEGFRRKGYVLAALTSLKQICNHPDQYSGGTRYAPEESGKFQLLQSLCETLRETHERVLVFTQFREIIPALDAFLSSIFGQKGLTLHGLTPKGQRDALVRRFNAETYCPYMILSLKVGGIGLNLTAATEVIHFDRWWNPAVENQATDRAYRIGQREDVLVHTLVTKGTIEEKIDRLLTEKQELSRKILSSSGENWLASLDDEELFRLCSLEEN